MALAFASPASTARKQRSATATLQRLGNGHRTMSDRPLTIVTLAGIPQVQPGDDVAELLIEALAGSATALSTQDIVVVTSKIVSKAEGRYVDLPALEPSERARELAQITGKDARLVEAILREAVEVIRAKQNVLIVATRQGLILANAGIDQSNLEVADHGRRALLLPADPDTSAQRIKDPLDQHFRADVGVVISDSVGRPWRLGTVGIAIGAAGVTEVAFADAVAAMAVLAMGEAAEGRPAALVRGLEWTAKVRPAAALVRPKAEDLFR